MEYFNPTENSKRRSPQSVHSPSLAALLFWVSGGIFAQYNSCSIWHALLISCGFLTVIHFTLNRHRSIIFILLVAFLAGTFWYHLFQKKTPIELLDTPEREAVLQLKVDRVFKASKANSQLGLATILKAPKHLDYLIGERCNYAIKTEKTINLEATVELRGILKLRKPSKEWSGFDRYLFRKQIHWSIFRAELIKVRESEFWLDNLRRFGLRKWENLLQAGNEFAKAESAVVTSMLLGQRWRLNEDQDFYFTQSGTLHFFAISGLHVGTLGLFASLLLTSMRIPQKWLFIPFAGTLATYVWITGSSASAVRAAIMLISFTLIFKFSRQPSAVAGFSLSAWIILLISPTEFWSMGFQLSYAVVAGILFIGIPLSNFLIHFTRHRYPAPFPQPFWFRIHEKSRIYFIQALSISLSATLTSSPFIISFFNLWTPSAILLNIILTPLIILTVFAGFLSIGFGSIFGDTTSIFWNHGAWVLVRSIEFLTIQWVDFWSFQSTREWLSSADPVIAIILSIGLAWLIQWIRQFLGKAPNFLTIIPILTGFAYIIFRSVNP